ncbi:restriction endonuclease subunit S [Hydromonas duriensis]|uniref:Type I restriction enzyme S subunit n=1 Tax=Hydromonas duriensis TaxID=1527608 RepID=A0A4R6Y6I1_9BURK|nr:restriction endonuclease subunit S [Hydromonas duriensis]TDR31052.1 type I restriction enzyme S subunit [Hydromonas duriensis]
MSKYNLVQNLEYLKKLPPGWAVCIFNEVVKDCSAGNKKTLSSDFLSEGSYPIVDQSKELIAGYTNDMSLLVNSEPPNIIFGDHTRIFKYIAFPFAMGADGIKILKPKQTTKLVEKYLYYFFLTLHIPNTGYNRHFKYLKKVKVPLPTYAEQEKIARILDVADDLRQKDQQLIDHYTALGQALFIKMFGEPVANSMAWERIELRNAGTLDRGKSKHRPRNAPELLGGSHPLIQTGDVANCQGYIREYKATYSDFGLKQSRKWPKGTLCITIAANIAKTGILTFDACFPDSVVGFTSNSKSNVEYVRYWLSFIQKILEDSAPMAAQKNINLKILKELEMPLPPIALQNQFAERIALIEAQKQQAQASLAQSQALFDSLLHRAFTGELTA